jgi:kynurenine formamidase
MKIQIEHKGKTLTADLSQPIDISIPVGDVRCFYSTEFKATPYVSGEFIGSVNKGAPVNFYDVQMNPHGNGTHTECLGHITKKQEFVTDQLKNFHFLASLVSVEFTILENGDKVVGLEALQRGLGSDPNEAVILRTLPNLEDKLGKDYSGTNPPYLTLDVMKWLVEKGVRHLLLDLPSVDREEDDGVLAAHHVFWNVKDGEAVDDSRADCTVTEMIYVPNDVEDGDYLLNIQIPSLKLDAAPSKPVIYKIENGK